MMSKDKKTKGYDSKITKQDKKLIGSEKENLRSDGGDDQQLKNRKRPVDFEGKDLDIPGRTLPENRRKKYLKDEENQLYSQGGPRKENLEENPHD